MYKVDKKTKQKKTGERSKPCKRRRNNTGERGWLLVLWTVRDCLVLVERCLKRGPCMTDEKIMFVKPGSSCTWASLPGTLCSDSAGSFSLGLQALGSACSGTRGWDAVCGCRGGSSVPWDGHCHHWRGWHSPQLFPPELWHSGWEAL